MKELKQEITSCIVYDNIKEFYDDVRDRKNPFYTVEKWQVHSINNVNYYKSPHSYKKPYHVLKEVDYLKIKNMCDVNYKINKELYLSSYSNDEDGNYYINFTSSQKPTKQEFIDKIVNRINSDIKSIKEYAEDDVRELEKLVNTLDKNIDEVYSISMKTLEETK